MDVVQPVTDTLATSWPAFAQHVFDKAWPLLAALLTGLVTGWLGLNRPAWVQRKPPPDAPAP